MKNKIGYARIPLSSNGEKLISLFETLTKDLGVDFCITKIYVVDKSWIEFEIFSEEKSWQQEHFVDGLYRIRIPA